MLLSGVQFGTHLDSTSTSSVWRAQSSHRLKHAGMTDFGMAMYLTQQATGNQPTDLENRKWSDSRRSQMLGEKIADKRAVAKRHVVANVIAAFK
jgi:hypothetical protein